MRTFEFENPEAKSRSDIGAKLPVSGVVLRRSANMWRMILDLARPGLSGLDFQAELVKASIHVPIIFMTGVASENSIGGVGVDCPGLQQKAAHH